MTAKTNQRGFRTRYDIDYLQRYCNDNNIILLYDYTNQIVNRETRILSKCVTDNCSNNVDKTFRDITKTGSCCIKCTKENRNDKFKETCIEKFGFASPLQSEEIKNKTKQSYMEKYGVEHIAQSDEFKNKVKQKSEKHNYTRNEIS